MTKRTSEVIKSTTSDRKLAELKKKHCFSSNLPSSNKVPLATQQTYSLSTLFLLTIDIKDWFRLGFELGIPAEDLKAIQCRHSKDEERARFDMILYWLEMSDYIPWLNFAAVLNKLGFDHAAAVIIGCIQEGKSNHFWLVGVYSM